MNVGRNVARKERKPELYVIRSRRLCVITINGRIYAYLVPEYYEAWKNQTALPKSVLRVTSFQRSRFSRSWTNEALIKLKASEPSKRLVGHGDSEVVLEKGPVPWIKSTST